MKDYQKYLIVCTGRTGSNALMNLLESHPNVVAHYEYVLDWYIKHREDGLSTQAKDAVARNVYGEYPPEILAAGFKFIYGHRYWKDVDGIACCQYLTDLPNLKVIHLKRVNKLHTLLSYERAKVTDRWHAFNEADVSKGDIQISLTPKRCLGFFKDTESQELAFDNLFETHEMLQVTYTQLVEAREQTIQHVLDFLGLPAASLSTSFHKFNHKHPSETLQNYAELKSHFSKTKWARFFND